MLLRRCLFRLAATRLLYSALDIVGRCGVSGISVFLPDGVGCQCRQKRDRYTGAEIERVFEIVGRFLKISRLFMKNYHF